MEELYVEFGRRLKAARRRAGATQEDLAGRVGLTRTSITNMERGRQHLPLHTLVRLADALGTTPEALVQGMTFAKDQIPGELLTRRQLRHVDPREARWIEQVVIRGANVANFIVVQKEPNEAS